MGFQKKSQQGIFLSVSTLHHSVEKTCGRTAKCGAIDRFIFEWCIRRSVKLLYREKIVGEEARYDEDRYILLLYIGSFS